MGRVGSPFLQGQSEFTGRLMFQLLIITGPSKVFSLSFVFVKFPEIRYFNDNCLRKCNFHSDCPSILPPGLSSDINVGPRATVHSSQEDLELGYPSFGPHGIYLCDLLSLPCNEVISSLSDVRMTFKNVPPPGQLTCYHDTELKTEGPIKS